MSDIDQQFIEYVVKSLVGNPDAVHIDRRVDDKGVLLELTVDPEDLGRVIGKRGATAQSLRTLLRALGTKNSARYNLKIIDNGVGREEREAGREAQMPRSDDSHEPVSGTSIVEDIAAELSNDKPEVQETIESPESPESPTPVAVEQPVAPEMPSDRLAATRRELAELDDLDL